MKVILPSIFVAMIGTLVAEVFDLVPEVTPSYRIAVLSDGDSWYFDEIRKGFEAPLESLASDHYHFELEMLDASYDPANVSALLTKALGDPAIDLIYASGVVATEIAKNLDQEMRAKPILAGAVQFSTGGAMVSRKGTSSLQNYTFIAEPQRVEADLALLKRLTGSSTIDVLVDSNFYQIFAQRDAFEAHLEKVLGVQLVMHPVRSSAEEALGKLPRDARAVYVPVLPRMGSDVRKVLYRKLAERGAVSVSMLGREDVSLGAMAGLATAGDSSLERRIALNIHQLLLGTPTEVLPVYVPTQDELVINAATAKATGWSPTYDLSLEADFLNDELFFDGAKITLAMAMAQAASDNAEVIVAREEEHIRRHTTDIARSVLLPQASFEAGVQGTSYSDQIDPAGPGYVRGGSYGVELRQVLFSDELSTDVRVLGRNAFAATLERRSKELDAVDAAATSYFRVLSARAQYVIGKDNLRLTQNNLQLARLRVDIGSAEPSEVFRWEQDVARGKAALIRAEAARADAVVEFNRVLGAPREAQWRFTDIELANDDYYFMNGELREIKTQADFQRFGIFLRWTATENSPELASFDAALGAQGEILRQKQRSFYVPEISAVAGADRIASSSDLRGSDAENELTIGVQFSLPLFEGGRRKAEVREQRASIRQLAAQRERAVQEIEQRALVAFNQLGATHPGILLSREALASAEKNYTAIRGKYAQGAASVLDLLDAQSALVSQKQEVANAVYAYLIQVHRMQRAIAWYEFDKTAGEKAEFEASISSFMKGGIPQKLVTAARGEAEAVVASAQVPGARPIKDTRPVKPVEKPKKRRGLLGLFR